ncbi:mechanosensitive ion channel domain-containing protein [Paraliomyxa miuraensis]|uniref:mechanosensitive ion channel domain-containing protein n=1 Tax=Paraliomyxa miuraensis TaxID=376150 RepID=UPI002254DA36|nr:mechanosensitive ion channel domain-containing protein [Paraliomyxa miuraensis]MCX4246905.1 mechanosensitive ion channel family protein [Paraliomyxa miuraensis]
MTRAHARARALGVRVLACLALWLGACSARLDERSEPPTELGAELLAEMWHLGDVFTPRMVLVVSLVLGVVLALRRALTLAVRVAWRLGWDPNRRLARVRSYLEIVLLTAAALLLGRELFRAVPLLLIMVLALGGLIAALALPGGLQDLAAGVSLAGRNRFLEGDQIEIAGFSGTVRHIGLLRSMLRLPDGRTLWLPNRDIVRSAVQVGREQQALPITVPLPSSADDPERREQLRRVAHLSPYRRAGSRPAVIQDGDRWVMTFQTWCTRRPDIAARAIDRQLRAAAQANQWEAKVP